MNDPGGTADRQPGARGLSRGSETPADSDALDGLGTLLAEEPSAEEPGAEEPPDRPPRVFGLGSHLRAVLRQNAAQLWSAHVTRPPDNAAGRALVLLSVLPALIAAAWLLVSFPLLLAGVFGPWTALPPFAVVAVVAARVVWRRAGGLTAPWWSVVATVAVALVFGIVAVATHAQHVIIERDPGSYAQFGYWLAHHGSLPITGQFNAFGGPDSRLSIESSAFYQQGTTVVPQFMVGWPLTLAGAAWLGGWTFLLSAPGIVGALAILAIGGLAARLIGARWAPLAALGCGLCFPILHMSQSTYSEPLAMLLFFGGFCLIADAGRAGGRSGASGGSRVLALFAGLLVGAVALVRLDAGQELALLLLVIGWMLVRRRREAWPLLIGLVVGSALGVIDGAVLSRPYVVQNFSSVKLLGLMIALCVAAVAVGVPLLRKVRDWSWLRRLRWPMVVIIAGVFVFFTVRPLIQEEHQYSPLAVVLNVARIQEEFGLPVDGTRTYGEYSLHWVSWWLGWPAIAFAAVGMCVLAWRLLHGRDLVWMPSVIVLFVSSILILYRPAITPDHPWADRRLVPVVLPGMVLFAVVGIKAIVAWFAGRLRDGEVLSPRAAFAGVLPSGPAPTPMGALPALGATSGERLRTAFAAGPDELGASAGWRTGGAPAPSGPGSRLARVLSALALRLDVPLAGALSLAIVIPAILGSKPLAFDRTEQGEVAAVQGVCEQLKPTDAVLLLNGMAQWGQTIRGECGVPVAALVDVTNTNITTFIQRIEATGHTVVLGAGNSPTPIEAYGLKAVHVTTVQFQWDEQSLTARPDRTNLGEHDLWLARPGAGPVGTPSPQGGSTSSPSPSASATGGSGGAPTPSADVQPFMTLGS